MSVFAMSAQACSDTEVSVLAHEHTLHRSPSVSLCRCYICAVYLVVFFHSSFHSSISQFYIWRLNLGTLLDHQVAASQITQLNLRSRN